MWGIVGKMYYLCSTFLIKEVRMRFLGNIEAKVDAKGRVFLPATFRKMLIASGEEALMLRKDVFQDCLVLYPETVWNQQMDDMRLRLNRWDKREQLVYRQFVSQVERITLDGNGRMLISKRFAQIAHITQDVKFIGMGDTIEIWCNSTTNEPFMDAGEFSAALEDLMGNMGNKEKLEHQEKTEI